MITTHEDILKRLAYDFAPAWCGALGCGGNHPEKDIYCNCAMARAEAILSTIEEFYTLTPLDDQESRE